MMGSLLYCNSNTTTLLTRRTTLCLFLSETTTMPMMCQDTITTQRLCVCPGAALVVVSPKQKANLILREEKVLLNKKTTIITWPRTWKSNHQGGLLCPEFFSPTATATATATTSVSTKYYQQTNKNPQAQVTTKPEPEPIIRTPKHHKTHNQQVFHAYSWSTHPMIDNLQKHLTFHTPIDQKVTHTQCWTTNWFPTTEVKWRRSHKSKISHTTVKLFLFFGHDIFL